MKIMLDAGHGLNTIGKETPDGMKEFEFNAAVAEYAKGILSNFLCEILFAHDPTGKIDIPLSKRTDYANRAGADVFVSIHANAFGPGGWNNVQGIETFVHTKKPQIALNLANLVQKKLLEATGRSSRGVKAADFHVLRENTMTAILAECGFMTNQEEAALLKSDEYRRKCAKAIAESLIEFYNLKPKVVKQVTTAAVKPVSPFAKDDHEWAVKNKISDGSRPHDPITRQEQLVITKRAHDFTMNEVKKLLEQK